MVCQCQSQSQCVCVCVCVCVWIQELQMCTQTRTDPHARTHNHQSTHTHTHTHTGDMNQLKLAHGLKLAGMARRIDEDVHFLMQVRYYRMCSLTIECVLLL